MAGRSDGSSTRRGRAETNPGGQSVWRDRLTKLGLTAGFAALAGGVLAAHATPARGYELSIYTATPDGFWLGAAVALAVAITVVSTTAVDDRLRSLALVLGGMAILTVVALPLVRGYYFYGGGDSLTHLGWVKDISNGTLNPWNFRYPGIHLLAVLGSEITGVPLRRALMFVLPVFATVYFLFVPLTVREIVGDGNWALALGAFSAFLLLPFNNISTHLNPHPITQAILFSPLLFYVAFRYVDPPPSDRSGADTRFPITAFGVLFATVSTTLVFYHPQQAVSMVALLVACCLVQLVYRSTWPDHPLGTHRPLYGQTVFLTVVTTAWAYTLPAARQVVAARTRQLWQFLTHPGETPVGQAVASRGESVSEIASLPELFVKLYFVDAYYVVLAVALVATALLTDRFNRSYEVKSRYLAAGTVPVAGFFVLFFLGRNFSGDYFRYSGFLMVIATVLGAVGIVYWFRVEKPAALQAASGAGLAVLLCLSVLVIFSSPYIYLPSDHVTNAGMEGHETAFDHQASGVEFVGIRSGPWRYSHAVDGTATGEEHSRYTGVPGDVLSRGLVGHFDRDRYLIVTRKDRRRELGAYRGLRYSRESFGAVRNRPGVHRVQSNGGFVLYHVESGWDTGSD